VKTYHLNPFTGVLTQKLPEVHVLPEPEILVYQSLEAREQVTGWKYKYIPHKKNRDFLTPAEVQLYIKHETAMRFGVFTVLFTRISLLAYEYSENDGYGLWNVSNKSPNTESRNSF